MTSIKRAMHFDFHTLPGIYDFNERWSAEKFAKELESAHVKYINFFAKCNLGFAYYPTKVGVPYPGLKGDMLGDVLRECHKRDIGVTAYFNGALDHEQARLHREWCIVDKKGHVISENKLDSFSRVMCCNTGYRKHLTDMVKEVVDNYDVDGIFIDCLSVKPCYGNECIEGMLKKGYNPAEEKDVMQFAKDVFLDTLRELKHICKDKNIFFNCWRDFLLVPQVRELCTHAELECLPDTWGGDFFAANAAYARNLKQDVLFMTGRFRDWGDFGSLKNKAAMQNDMWDALMNKTEFSIGDHLHPTETIEPALLKSVKSLYSDMMIYEQFTEDTTFRAEIGVLTDGNLQDEWYWGIARMLGELKYAFDFLNGNMDFNKYNLLIIPDNVRLDKSLESKISSYIESGGKILSTGEGGLSTDINENDRAMMRITEYTNTGKELVTVGSGNESGEEKFALPNWGFELVGIDENTQGYYKMPTDTKNDFEGFRWGMYDMGILIKQGVGKKLAGYIKPYFNKHWDGLHAYMYTPPEKETDFCAAAINGNIIHICFKVFSAYCRYAISGHKFLVKYCIDKLLPNSLFICDELPSTARIALTEKAEYALLHIKVTFAESRGQSYVIEEHQVLKEGKKISVKGVFKSAVAALDNKELPIKIENGYTQIRLPEITGYLMIKLSK